MNTTSEERTNASRTQDDDFLTYPLYKVVGVFSDDKQVEATVAELHSKGFTSDELESFCGLTGENRLDFDGTKHGIWASFVRDVQHLGPDQAFLERYQKDLENGDCLIMVRVADRDRKDIATRVLHEHTKERVVYFGLLLIEEV